MLWKATEWESISGWRCNCVDDLAHDSAAWWHPARILGVSPADFLSLLFEKFKPDVFYFNEETCFCSWAWESQTAERAYKNWINAAARKKNYQV